MANTTNFGWETPDDTDLVKDGAAAMRTLGNSIDASFVDLKGGTSGQILSKNSNTDLDYVWIDNDQGDITAVTAGTGLTGGGTAGAVTLTNDMATTITASGDIVVGTGSGTYDNLPIGTTGQVLTADTTVSPYKVKWANAAGGGKVLQVVQSTTTTQTTIQSTTYTDSGLSASITPSLATSKILIYTFQYVLLDRDNNATDCYVQLLRDSTALIAPPDVVLNLAAVGTTEVYLGVPYNIVYLDSPSTTSSITYKTQGKLSTTTNLNRLRFQHNSITSVMVLMEIGA